MSIEDDEDNLYDSYNGGKEPSSETDEDLEEIDEPEDSEEDLEPIDDPREESKFEDDQNQDEWGGADEQKEVKKKDSKRNELGRAYKRLQDERLQKNQLIDDARHAREEAEHYKQMAELANQSATFNYGLTAEQRLIAAKKLKKEAYESQDTDMLVNADAELTAATLEFQKANDFKMQQELNTQRQQQQQQYHQQRQSMDPFELNQRDVQHWLSKNTWADNTSVEYNKELANLAIIKGDQLALWCYNNGCPEKIYSREFFDSLNQKLQQEINQSQRNSTNRRQIPMRKVRMGEGVSPVRSGGNHSQANKHKPLTPEQEHLRRNIGCSEKDFRKGIQLADREVELQRRMQ